MTDRRRLVEEFNRWEPGTSPVARLDRRPAYWTHDDAAGHLYYFAPANRAPGPYRRQIEVTALVDIADDGTLAGVELIDRMPPPPALPAPSPVAGMETTAEDYSLLHVLAEARRGKHPAWPMTQDGQRAASSYHDAVQRVLPGLLRDFDRQSAEIARLTAELAEARAYVEGQIEERITELNADGEAFDKECHNALRWLLINECGDGGQELVDDVDGWSAENATQCIAECLREARADVAKAREEERGACLIIAHDAEKLVGSVISTAASEWRNACRHIAAAIRARSTGTLPADRKPWFADEAAAAFGVDRNVLARRLVAFADTLANDDADLIMEAVAFIRLPAAVPADRA